VVLLLLPAIFSQDTGFEKLKRDTIHKEGAIDILDADILPIVNGRHNYSIILLLTTRNPAMPAWEMCKGVNVEYRRAGEEFYGYNGGASGLNSDGFKADPTFMVVCDVEKCRELIGKAKWTTIPKIVHIPASQSKSFDMSKWKEMELNALKAEDIAAFISRERKIDFKILPSAIERFAPFASILAAAAICWRLLRGYWKDPTLWFLVSLAVFGFSMAGVVFNAIHAPPFAYTNPQNKQTMWIYPQARMQFVSEGIIMAVLLIFTGLVWVTFGALIPKIRPGMYQRLAFVGSVLAYVICYSAVQSIFKIKYSWYPFA